MKFINSWRVLQGQLAKEALDDGLEGGGNAVVREERGGKNLMDEFGVGLLKIVFIHRHHILQMLLIQ